MTDNIYTFRGYELECYPQPNNTYWGICRELGIRVRGDSFTLLAANFQQEVEKAKYKVYLLWSCDQEEYYCTNDDVYVIEDLQESLPELAERIQDIEKRNTIIAVDVNKL